MVTDALADQLDYIYDITVGYSGLEKEDIPYEEYLIDKVFFSKYYPEEIHMHVRRFKLSDIPGVPTNDTPNLTVDEKNHFDAESEKRKGEFTNWLNDRFMEKDAFMREFYQNGKFEGEPKVWQPRPTGEDLLIIGIIIGSSFITIPLCFKLISTVLSVTFSTIYWWIMRVYNYNF
jgi:hypothetical protein